MLRIKWSTSELEIVLNAIKALVAKQPDIKPLDAVRFAQEKLPSKRQRSLTQWSNLSPYLRSRVIKVLTAVPVSTVPQLPPPPPPPEIVTLESASDAAIFAEFLHRIDKRNSAAVEAVNLLHKRLDGVEVQFQTFHHRLADIEAYGELVTEELDEIRRGTASAKSTIVFAPPSIKTGEIKPIFSVIGLRDRDIRLLNRRLEEYGLNVEIQHLTTDTQPPPNLRLKGNYALVVRFASHSWWDSAREALSKDRVFYVDGGANAVAYKIKHILGA